MLPYGSLEGNASIFSEQYSRRLCASTHLTYKIFIDFICVIDVIRAQLPQIYESCPVPHFSYVFNLPAPIIQNMGLQDEAATNLTIMHSSFDLDHTSFLETTWLKCWHTCDTLHKDFSSRQRNIRMRTSTGRCFMFIAIPLRLLLIKTVVKLKKILPTPRYQS